MFLKNRMAESKILFIYRYLSLMLTSIFYLFNIPEHTLLRKLFIIGCISISAIILSYLYPVFENSKKNILLLLIMETIGNLLLLIPSGGIDSPFIWYTLNTILISSIYFGKYYCWLNFLAYILGYMTILKYGINLEISDIEAIREQSNLLLSFLMIIAAVNLLGIYINKANDKSKKLEETNLELEQANKQTLESIEHIKALYQSVGILGNQRNKEGIIKISFEHIKQITKSNTAFYYDISENENKMYSYGDTKCIDHVEGYIRENFEEIFGDKTIDELHIHNNRYIITKVTSNYKAYGLLGLECTDGNNSIIYKNNVYQLQFISELLSLSFERLSLEGVNERLLISEEQNRIANEIHDTVLQKLFSMSCSIFATIKRLNSYSKQEIEEELNLIRNTTDSVMKELREKIYGLSWKKSGTNSFTVDIRNFIDEIIRLNNVNIPFSILGNVEILTTNQKKALYRMICEGLSNAVRHGKAKNVDITLNVDGETTRLSIIDDGIGFEIEDVMSSESKGLGLENLHQLTESLNGEIEIVSELSVGTTINITLPNNLEVLKGAVAI
jgi:signal transduction histidine kinase